MTRALPLLLLAGCTPVVVDFGDKPGDTGSVVSGAIAVTPASSDLGVVFVGERAGASFSVSNVGDGPVALAVELATPDGAAWSYALASDDPAPGEDTELIVTFAPTAWGAFSATVTVSDTAGSDGSVDLPLTATAQEDADEDGVGSVDSGGTDCDDTDASIHPGAPDPWYDGVDSDCGGNDDFDQDADGVTVDGDCDDTDGTVHPGAPDSWYDGVDSDCAGNDDFDQDLDGVPAGADCDDMDASIHPGAADTWYDGIDSDCAGNDDHDRDYDGYALEVDCNDNDATVYPGAADNWYDGVDADCAGDDDFDQDLDGVQWPTDCDDEDATVGGPTDESWNGLDDDCDGSVDELSVSDAAAGALYGATSSLALGERGTLSLGGDLDGDGADDLIAVSDEGSGGGGWLVSGASAVGAAGVITDYDRAAFSGSSSYELTYVQGPMADLTGDATDDVLIGTWSSYVGAAPYLDGDAATGAITITSTYSGYFVGDSVYDVTRWAVAGDVDGDGVADVVTGSVLDNYGSYAYYTGNVGVFQGGDFSGVYDLDDTDDEIHGTDAYDYLGTSLALGDVTGDGYVDIVAGASGSDAGASNGGAVYVFLGNASLEWDDQADDAASVFVVGATNSMELGAEALPTPGDVDGDGAADVGMADAGAGGAYVFTGLVGLSGTVAVTDADASWAGPISSFATAIAMGDLDDDGLADVSIGASGDDTAGSNAGAVYLFYGGGSWTTSMSSGDADASIYGAAAGDALGSGLAAGGDLDADGSDDLLLGASGVDTGASGGGAVYVLLGR